MVSVGQPTLVATRLNSDYDVGGRACGRTELRAQFGERSIVLSIDRFDYTKGISERLAAIEQLFVTHAALRERTHVVQILVPTRETVDAYADYRRAVLEQCGALNARYGSVSRRLALRSLHRRAPLSPFLRRAARAARRRRRSVVHVVNRSVDKVELSALYSLADVMLVTPLRDG